MEQIKKNKAELWADILELADAPLNHTRGKMLVEYLAVYDALCRVSHAEHGADEYDDDEPVEEPHFSPQMAEEWVAKMRNADGSKGPHFSKEKAREIQKQYNVDCDELEFWAVINSLYSDYDQALKKNNASTLELYACLAKAWIEDQDAVPNKIAAYYTYVVEH